MCLLLLPCNALLKISDRVGDRLLDVLDRGGLCGGVEAVVGGVVDDLVPHAPRLDEADELAGVVAGDDGGVVGRERLPHPTRETS